MFIADTSNRDIRITQKVHELDHMCVCVCRNMHNMYRVYCSYLQPNFQASALRAPKP